jgi:predicted permease
MNLRDLQLRARALFTPRRVERELNEELSFHLERETQHLIDQGMEPAEARVQAQARFGSVPLAADECRDERGTAFVDNTVRDVLYAFRTFQRAPLVAFTIVSTVALGLGLVAVVFTFLNTFLFRIDAVPDIHEMFAVERPRTGDERPPFTRAQYEALRRETSVFTDAYAELADFDSRIDGRMMAGTLVTGNFFQVLRVQAVLGRTLLPGDDDHAQGQPVMVLSHKGWDRQFARDPAVLGRRVLVNGISTEIIGVMPEGFRGLTVGPPDYWAPLSLVGQFRPIHRGREDRVGIGIIGRLKPNLSAQTALAGLMVWDSAQQDAAAIDPSTSSGSSRATSRGDRRVANITLVPRRGTIPQPLEAMILFAPLFFAFGLILMIGCANVANLLLARGVARQREIGIRLSLGASRRRIIRQLLTESLLLAIVAAGAGFLISRIALEAIIYAVMNSMAADIGDVRLAVPDADWRVLLFLLLGAFVATVFFALVPALQATRVAPVRTIRGEVMPDARPERARNILIGLQVAASALLLISSAVFLRSAFASATVDSGMRTADTVIVEMLNEPMRQRMVQAVLADASVAMVGASWPEVPGATRAMFAEARGRKATVAIKFASPEYFSVLDIPIVRGRGFSAAEAAGHLPVALLSETIARELWPGADAVGQVMQLEADPGSPTRRDDEPQLTSRTFTIVGIVRDVVGFRFFSEFTATGIYVPADTATAATSLILRVHGDPELARRTLLDRLTLVDPSMGQVVTLRTIARMETYFLQIAFWLTLVLGGLALVLTLSGLFSVLSYLVEQRTREIGVRMALGATTQNVSRLVLSQSIRPVGIGLLIGAGLSLGLAIALMATPAASSIGQIVHVFDPVAYAVSLLTIVTACLAAASIPARRAAHVDPATTLRQE